MAITISTNLAKKIPVPDLAYASLQASISITAEVTDLAQIPAEAIRLYQLAEAAIDLQLTQSTAPSASSALPTPPAQPSTDAGRTADNSPAATLTSPRAASRPYRGQSRRAPAPVTENQLRYLDRLLGETGTPVEPILQTYQVGSLLDLSCKQAAELIDQLKATSPR